MTDSIFLPRGLILTTQSTEPTVYLCNLLVAFHSSLEVIILNAHFIASKHTRKVHHCMPAPHDGERDIIHDEHGFKIGQREVQKRTKGESESRRVSLLRKARLVIVRMKR